MLYTIRLQKCYTRCYTPRGVHASRGQDQPINRSLNFLMKSSCSDFARSSSSSWIQVLICHSGLSCCGYLSSNVGVFISIIFWIHIYYRRSVVNRLQTVERSGSNGRVRFRSRPDIALRYKLTAKG